MIPVPARTNVWLAAGITDTRLRCLYNHRAFKMTTDLAEKSCTPCRGGIPPLSSVEVANLLPQAVGWEVIDDHTKIEGHFKFKNFGMSLDFVRQVGELAEAEFHHPLFIKFGWGFTTIVLQTKKIKGLHENDFIMAAKINTIARAISEQAAS